MPVDPSTVFPTVTNADRLALVDDAGTERTFGELVDRATRLGRAMREAGVPAGGHVGTLTENRAEFFELYLASILSGVWLVPINGLLAPAEVAHVVDDAGLDLVFAEHELAGLVPDGVRIVDLDDEYGSLVAGADDTPFPLDGPPGSRFSYTSGTTGHPKGVKRAIPDTVEAMLALQRQAGLDVAMTGDGVHLVTGPAYHAAVGGFAFFDLCNGATVRLMRRFDAGRTLEIVEAESVRRTHLVPTMMVRMLRLDDATRARDLSSLELVLHGAAPIAPAVKRRMIDWLGPILTEYWGTSEAGVFTRVDSDDWLDHPGTVGRPVPGFEVFAVDDDGATLPAGTVGRLFCHTPAKPEPFAYWNAPDKTAGAYLRPGVFTLGDMGHVDADGWIFLADRATNMIISGGVNVYPAEVEQALLEHPSVVDVAVFGIPDEEWGEQVKVAVEFADGADVLADDLLAFARDRLGRHKVPRSIDVHDHLPRQPNGKLYLASLRDPYWAGHDRRI
ncbi:MAG: AMP-binding protein [Actinomycetota bacterium]